MKNIITKYPKLQNSYTVIKISLTAFFVIWLVDSFLMWNYSSEKVAWTVILFPITVMTFMLIGILKEYRWAEVLAMFLTSGACYYHIYTIAFGLPESSNSVVFSSTRYILSAINAILSLAVFVLIFIVRFNRSKEMTENFVEYK